MGIVGYRLSYSLRLCREVYTERRTLHLGGEIRAVQHPGGGNLTHAPAILEYNNCILGIVGTAVSIGFRLNPIVDGLQMSVKVRSATTVWELHVSERLCVNIAAQAPITIDKNYAYKC